MARIKQHEYVAIVKSAGMRKGMRMTFWSASDAKAKGYASGLLLHRQPKGHRVTSIKATGRSRFKTTKARKRNPISNGTQVEAAVELGEAFSGHVVQNTRKRKIPTSRVAYEVGPIARIDYLATRDGKPFRFQHEFKDRSRPLLAVTHDGENLLILGGGYSFTEDGIVDH